MDLQLFERGLSHKEVICFGLEWVIAFDLLITKTSFCKIVTAALVCDTISLGGDLF